MAKLPVRETILETYRYTFAHIGKIIGLIWLPQLLITLGGYYFLKPYLTFLAGNPDGAELMQHGPLILGMYGYCLIAVLLFAWIAAALIREILAPTEGAPFFAFPPPAPVFRTVGGLFALLGLFLIFAMAMGILVVVLDKLMPAGSMVAVALCLGALLYFGLRLGFLLIPATIAEEKLGLVRSWQLTNGHFWKLLAIILATTVPVSLVSQIAQTAILGPDQFRDLLGSFKDAAAMAHHNAEQVRLMSEKLPFLMGLNFFLAPFVAGLTVFPTVFVYKHLTQAPTEEPNHTEIV